MKAWIKKAGATFGLAVLSGLGSALGANIIKNGIPNMSLPSISKPVGSSKYDETLNSDTAVPPDWDNMNAIMEALRRKGE